MKVVALFGLLLLAYWPALHGAFIWDDITFIVDNELLRQPLSKIWFSHEATDYWPVSYTLFWVMWRVFGTATLGYHLVNLAIHFVNACLVWRLLRGWRGAYVLALLFALHPVNVEAVAWIFQIKTTLAMTIALLSLWAFLQRSRRMYLASLALFALALLTKSSVILWPFLFAGVARRRLAALPFFALSLAAGWLSLSWYSYDQTVAGERIYVGDWSQRLLDAFKAFCFYLQKAFVPYPLNFVYPALTWSVVFALLFALALSRRAAWAYYVVCIFPVLGFVDIYFMRYSPVADHWQYLALLAPLAMIVVKFPRASVLLVPIYAVLTFQRAQVFGTEEGVWRDTLAKNPHAWMAHSNLGAILLGSGRADAAVGEFELALADKPDFVEPYINLGVYHLGRGEAEQAREFFEKALQVFPYNARALNNLASLALQAGRVEEARDDLLLAVTHLPTYTRGFENLAIVYDRLGQPEKATEARERARALRGL